MIPAAPLADMQAESTPIYGQAADAVTWEGIMTDLIIEELGPGPIEVMTAPDGCPECAEAGVRCLIGETPMRSGRDRVVYPLSVACDEGDCDDCDEVRA